MSRFTKLHEICTKSVIEDYFQAKRIAEENREREIHAATQIQKVYRQFATRKHAAHVRKSAITIQKIMRSFLARRRFRERKAQHKIDTTRQFYNWKATLIQKIFRGYYTRKYELDYYARKQYIIQVIKQTEAVRQMAKEYAEKQATEIETKIAEKKRNEFEFAARHLHHLVSTRSINGVYKTPNDPLSESTVYNTNIEDTLREATRRSLEEQNSTTRSRSLSRGQNSFSASRSQTLTSTNQSQSFLPQIVSTGGSSRKSSYNTTQQSTVDRCALHTRVKYDFVKEQLSFEKQVEKKLFISDRDFRVTKPPTPKYTPALGNGTSASTLIRTDDKSKRISQQPMRTGKRKSELFDESLPFVDSATIRYRKS